jgi:hypothetical protein
VVHHHPARPPAVAPRDLVAVAGRQRERPQLLARAEEALEHRPLRARPVAPLAVGPAVGVDDVVQHHLRLRHLDAVAGDEPRVHADDRAVDRRRAHRVGPVRHPVRPDPVRPEAEDVRLQARVGEVLGRRRRHGDQPRAAALGGGGRTGQEKRRDRD